jgi:hypothetical protein
MPSATRRHPAGDYKVVVRRDRKIGKKGGDDDRGVRLLPARCSEPETSGPSTTITRYQDYVGNASVDQVRPLHPHTPGD